MSTDSEARKGIHAIIRGDYVLTPSERAGLEKVLGGDMPRVGSWRVAGDVEVVQEYQSRYIRLTIHSVVGLMLPVRITFGECLKHVEQEPMGERVTHHIQLSPGTMTIGEPIMPNVPDVPNVPAPRPRAGDQRPDNGEPYYT